MPRTRGQGGRLIDPYNRERVCDYTRPTPFPPYTRQEYLNFTHPPPLPSAKTTMATSKQCEELFLQDEDDVWEEEDDREDYDPEDGDEEKKEMHEEKVRDAAAIFQRASLNLCSPTIYCSVMKNTRVL